MTDDPARQRLVAATDAWRAAPDDLAARTRLARVLARTPRLAGRAHQEPIAAMIRDPRIDPAQFECAGWHAIAAPSLDLDDTGFARWLEDNDLAIALLEEAQVVSTVAERLLSHIRRWLLLTGRTSDFPRATAALIRQAQINGGAWPFAADERAALADQPGFAASYVPPPPSEASRIDHADPVTRAVAAQYSSWPYPVWQRMNALPGPSLAAILRARGGDVPPLPPHPDILVAGCGTGREALTLARIAPEGQVAAIELSEASLAIARDRCAGQPNLRLLRHDLHAVADLGQRFDHVSCSGVLHHLANPEAGWAALVNVLAPNGTMRIALYSRLARANVLAVRQSLGDQAATDDAVREARRQLIAAPVAGITSSRDFFSVAGARDLLFHAHEDCFDLPRIARALDTLDLRLLGLDMPTPDAAADYRAAAPHDPLQRDLAALHAWETRNPTAFASMYRLTVARR